MIESKYKGKISQYGILGGDTDPNTGQVKPPQFFCQFDFVDENGANQKLAWFGGFKMLQPGKKTSQREITLKTIQTLGFVGTDIESLADGIVSGRLNVEKEFELDIQHAKDQMGSVKLEDNGNPKFQIAWVNDPEKVGFKNQLKKADAAVQLGGLNLGADLAQMQGGQSGGNANPYANHGQQNVGNNQQNTGNNQNVNNVQNMGNNQNLNNNQNQNQQNVSNGQNQNQQNQQNVNNGQNNYSQQDQQNMLNQNANTQQNPTGPQGQDMGFNNGKPPF